MSETIKPTGSTTSNELPGHVPAHIRNAVGSNCLNPQPDGEREGKNLNCLGRGEPAGTSEPSVGIAAALMALVAGFGSGSTEGTSNLVIADNGPNLP